MALVICDLSSLSQSVPKTAVTESGRYSSISGGYTSAAAEHLKKQAFSKIASLIELPDFYFEGV